MMNDKFLNLLGLCKRAGKLSMGHDASFESISKNKAKLCILSLNASERLKNEFRKTVSYEDRKVPLIESNYTMEQFQNAISSKVAVMTVNDKGFARKLIELNNELHEEDNN